MRINKYLLLLLFIIFLGFILVSFKTNSSPIKPIDFNSLPKSCNYNGTTYKSGEDVPSGDSCNSCSCEDGNISCTTMYCE